MCAAQRRRGLSANQREVTPISAETTFAEVPPVLSCHP